MFTLFKPSKFQCPYCYKHHRKEDCIIICQGEERCGKIKTISKTIKDKMFRMVIPDDAISYCNKHCDEPKQYLCPDFVRDIPTELIESKNALPIALVGGKGSGKSNYIAVLIEEIGSRMMPSFGCQINIRACNESYILYNENYYKPLYKDKVVVSATDLSAQTSLVFPLRFYKGKNKDIFKSLPLVLYDSAGEHFQASVQEDMGLTTDYLLSAGSLIFLIDPFKLSVVRKKIIERNMKIPDTAPVENQSNNIENADEILQLIANIMRKNKRARIKTPIAVVLTKADILDTLELVPHDRRIFRDSESLEGGIYIDEERRQISNDILGILNQCDPGSIGKSILNIVSTNFTTYSFFAVSSFGGMPTGDNMDKLNEIRPHRVLDPLLWLLSLNGFLPKEE